ncbi:hypothetical protein FA95DRAFT_562458 [Auriscalpium vulgare]|uniref:Uncharacterized protein n=1 Tax=Auriscalpium vulgare TaxID=40419 RepID=A0ACB8REU1_9AGAM|nr:hypothetical protein FA95DRAFT_562458 [Auriscalpium vulgare]
MFDVRPSCVRPPPVPPVSLCTCSAAGHLAEIHRQALTHAQTSDFCSALRCDYRYSSTWGPGTVSGTSTCRCLLCARTSRKSGAALRVEARRLQVQRPAACCLSLFGSAAASTLNPSENRSEYSRQYVAPTLRYSDVSFQKALVAFDARRRVPVMRIYAARWFPNIPLYNLAVYLDYTKTSEPECALVNPFVNDSERAHAMQHEGSDYRASTTIWYKIQLGEYEEVWTVKVASLWSEDDVGGDIAEKVRRMQSSSRGRKM